MNMTKIYLLTAGLALLPIAAKAQVHQAQQRTTASAPPAELGPLAFKSTIDQGKAVLVDVRTPAEFSNGHIAGATNIDWTADNYQAGFAKLDKDKPVLLYCHSGGRSEQALEYLLGRGYQVQHLGGGFAAWRKSGLPVVK